MNEDVKGLARAVATVRAELHSLGLGGSRIVLEVDAEKWHALRVKASAAGDVEEIALVTDVVAGDVVVRQKPIAAVPASTLEQLRDLGLQPPPLEHRVGVLEKAMRQLVEGLPVAMGVRR